MPVKQIISFIFFPAVSIFLFTLNPVIEITSLLFFIGGLIVWNFFEYVFHRAVFHNIKLPKTIKKAISHGHRYHHRYPHKTDNLLLPLRLTITLSLASLGIVYLLFGVSQLSWFYTGLWGGLFIYEFMHYAAHHLKINISFFKAMKRYHLEHHFHTPNSKFMVTNPLMDYLFRTHH